MTSVIPVQRSNQLSYANQLGAAHLLIRNDPVDGETSDSEY